ncbi:MAG TPA: YkvA family protein [Anaerolineales bacterium]|nr:YkvA family protein [Anaerolineales bacterium]
MFEKSGQEYVREGAEKVTPQDIDKVADKSEEIKDQFRSRGPLKRFIEDGKALTALIRDWRAGRYRQALYGTIAAVAFALLYVFNPFDLLPDVLPFVGALDDATVIGAVLMLVERDLKKYRIWKESQLISKDIKG